MAAKKSMDQNTSFTIRNQVFVSEDFGKTWKNRRLKSKFGDFGDPSIIADNNGYFYYFHMSDPQKQGWKSNIVMDRIVCQRSFNGRSWSRGSYAGHNPPKACTDPWAAFDDRSGRIYVTWTQFDKYASDNPQDSAHVMFSFSNDRGLSWTPKVRINLLGGDCMDNATSPVGAMPAIGINGEVYVCWSNNNIIYFDRSKDGGISWLKKDIVVSDQPGGWSFFAPEISNACGKPVIDCDKSYGDYHGTIYINWADQRDEEDGSDIWIAKSTDGGDSWSKPVKVNTDKKEHPGKYQFQNHMCVDPITGIIYVVYYHQREGINAEVDVFLAWSNDGGTTFTNECISASPFKSDSDIYIGEYIHISAIAGIVRPVWTRIDHGLLSVWTALVNFR